MSAQLNGWETRFRGSGLAVDSPTLAPRVGAVAGGGVADRWCRGFILAAAASARRVEDTYQTFIEEIDAPDVVVVPACARLVTAFGCAAPAEEVSGEAMVEALESVEVVERAKVGRSVMPYLVDSGGKPLLATPDDPYGCVDGDRAVHLVDLAPGAAETQAIPFHLDGALPKPGGCSEVVVALATAKREGIEVGDMVRVAGWCDGDGDPVRTSRAIVLTVTGVAISPSASNPRKWQGN